MMLQLASTFRVQRGRDSSGFDGAIFKAYQQLPTQVEDEINVIVAFDSGAPNLTIGAGCRQADRVGVIIAGIPGLIGVLVGVHWLGTLLAVITFAVWCGYGPEPRRA